MENVRLGFGAGGVAVVVVMGDGLVMIAGHSSFQCARCKLDNDKVDRDEQKATRDGRWTTDAGTQERKKKEKRLKKRVRARCAMHWGRWVYIYIIYIHTRCYTGIEQLAKPKQASGVRAGTAKRLAADMKVLSPHGATLAHTRAEDSGLLLPRTSPW